ncbi:MAG TPA: MFS transporter, partial [Chromatiales bacterium]|nr:MFS transporter [Chromatiales bacterium]HEX21859.1 MFS transporter [Chromatiales bacterium]
MNRTASLRETLRVYRDVRFGKIFLIGIISGFPWALIGSAMTLWLKDEGFSRSAIGLFGVVFAVYAINFLWAPLIDRIHIPLLSARLGQRRAWIVLMQIVIGVSMVGMFFVTPDQQLWWVAALAVVIATASATQDITIDALRIELIGKDEQTQVAAGAAMATGGWWTGYNVGGAVALYLAGYYQGLGIGNAWQLVYVSLVAIVVVCNLGLFWVREPSGRRRRARQTQDDEKMRNAMARLGVSRSRWGRALSWIAGTFSMPLVSFFRSNGVKIAFALLGFIFLFKVGEAFLGRMSLVFYQEIGFSKAEIATYSKLVGWITIFVFAVIGSLINARIGLVKGLFVSGIAMASTNLLFAWLALVGPEIWLFAAAVILDQFTTAVSTVTFVAFISQLADRAYTATQYALMASLGNLGRTTLSANSGIVVDWLDGNWALFFVITALMVIPSLFLLALLSRRLGG